jgi:hypothetical protein
MKTAAEAAVVVCIHQRGGVIAKSFAAHSSLPRS